MVGIFDDRTKHQPSIKWKKLVYQSKQKSPPGG